MESSLHGIQDLRPLAIPPQHGSSAWLIAIALSALMLAGWWLWRRWQNPRARANRRLRRLQRSANPCGRSARLDRELAREVARALASGIGAHYLGSNTRLPTPLRHQQARWQDFLTRLSRCRYAGHDNHPRPARPNQLAELAGEARYWLRQWPTGSDSA